MGGGWVGRGEWGDFKMAYFLRGILCPKMAYFLGRNKNMIYSKFSLLRQFLASEGQY